jgi:hypothetical protein
MQACLQEHSKEFRQVTRLTLGNLAQICSSEQAVDVALKESYHGDDFDSGEGCHASSRDLLCLGRILHRESNCGKRPVTRLFTIAYWVVSNATNFLKVDSEQADVL